MGLLKETAGEPHPFLLDIPSGSNSCHQRLGRVCHLWALAVPGSGHRTRDDDQSAGLKSQRSPLAMLPYT